MTTKNRYLHNRLLFDLQREYKKETIRSVSVQESNVSRAAEPEAWQCSKCNQFSAEKKKTVLLSRSIHNKENLHFQQKYAIFILALHMHASF